MYNQQQVNYSELVEGKYRSYFLDPSLRFRMTILFECKKPLHTGLTMPTCSKTAAHTRRQT
jgi:hypothetical protein